MNISRIFIERPIMTTLVMAALVIFGLFGYFTLPVSDLPNVDFPTVSVSAQLPGADPVTMASGVAGPLENSFSTIPGIDQMTSSSSIGQTNITIQFALDRNIDLAAQDVQAAISAALGQLPKALPRPPSFRKVNPNDQPIMYIVMGSDSIGLNDLDEYAETLLARQISTIEGVAQIQVFGQGKYGVRDPGRSGWRWRRARSALTSSRTPSPPPMSTSPPAPSMASARQPPSWPPAN